MAVFSLIGTVFRLEAVAFLTVVALCANSMKADEWPPFQQGLGGEFGDPESEIQAIQRFLRDSPFTEEEAERHIRTAIAYWIKNRQDSTIWAEASDGSYEGRRERPVMLYTSVDEFLAANPLCCYFHTRSYDGYEPGAWFRFWNNYLGIAVVDRYRSRFADNGETNFVYGFGFLIDADGNVIETELGR